MRSPASAFRTSRSMQARNAAKVFPEPVGAEIRVVCPARMCGHPCSCGSVGVPNRCTNQSRTSGCAQASEEGRDDILDILSRTFRKMFAYSGAGMQRFTIHWRALPLHRVIALWGTRGIKRRGYVVMTHKIYAATIGLVLALTALAQAQTFTTLYTFTGGSDGNMPYAGVIDVNGNLYGTTYEGGSNGVGAVFEVKGNGQEKTIYSFGFPPDGNSPRAPLIRASNGKLYGVASFGGANNNYGAVFEIDRSGAESVLYS